MLVQIKTTKLELTENLKKYTESKIEMLEKYLGSVDAQNCDVELSMEGSHSKGKIFRAEINLSVPGSMLRVEKTEQDIYKAIDKVKDHLVLRIKKYKEKKIAKKRK